MSSRSQYSPLTTNSIGIEKKCPVCKKTFFVHDPRHHAYKILGARRMKIPVCSWKCLRVHEEKTLGKMEAKRKLKIESQLRGGL